MKRTLIGFAALLAFALVSPDVLAQQQRGNRGAGQGRGSSGTAVQSRAQVQTQVGVKTPPGNPGLGRNQCPLQLGNKGQQSIGLLPAMTVSLDLLRMREEERLARDVYTKLAETSNVPIFHNISRAENQHMQAVERLIGGATGSALNDTPGTFRDPDYQQLYQSLVASGTRSPLDALMVGAKIEEMDIADLQRLLAQTTSPQVQMVLENLMRGSHNHLRAFASQIAMQGASYNAEFLTQAQFDEIANSSGQGSQFRGNGKQFGFQTQSSNGQGYGGSNQNGQGGRRGRGNQGRGR